MNRTLVVLLAGLALALRVAIIHRFTGGGTDLGIYYYFGDLVRQGLNPYLAPADGPISPRYADMPPANLGLFAAVLAIHDSPVALRYAFAVVDALIVLGLGLGLRRPAGERLFLIGIYAFNPLFLMSWVTMSEDKPIILLLLVATLIFLDKGRRFASVLVTTMLSIYKWMGLFFVAPLIAHVAKGRRNVLIYAAVFLLMFAAAHIPYFPENLRAYDYRMARAQVSPTHSSIMLVLSSLNLYHPILVKLLIVLSVGTVYWLFHRRRISIAETVVLAVFGGYAFSPEISLDRILLITFPLLLVIRLTPARMVAIAIVMLLISVAAAVETKGLPFGWNATHLGSICHSLFGDVGTVQCALWANLFPAIALVLYGRDKAADWRRSPS